MFKKYILAAALLAASSGAALADTGMCRIADAAIQSASEIRELKIKKTVPCEIQGKDKVKEYLINTLKEDLPPRKLKNEEAIYKALGFIPRDFDYEKGLVDLYLGQIGGYYDPKKSHYIMAEWIPELLQTTVAVHELTHALQDQYFDLKKFMDMKLDNGDVLLARSALVEGDATAVMIDYSRKISGQPLIQKDPNVQSFMLQNIVGASVAASMGNVPTSLQMLLMFPYTSGLRFTHHLLVKGGYKAVSAAFTRPPRSTEEILHPEKYDADKPDFVEITEKELADEAGLADYNVIYRDTLGEFAISALLGMHNQDGAAVAEAAAGWGGDRVAVFEKGVERVIVWKTAWDTEKDAQEFYDAYIRALGDVYPEQKTFDQEWRRVADKTEARVVRGPKTVRLEVRLKS